MKNRPFAAVLVLFVSAPLVLDELPTILGSLDFDLTAPWILLMVVLATLVGAALTRQRRADLEVYGDLER